MTQAVYGRVTDDRLTAAADVSSRRYATKYDTGVMRVDPDNEQTRSDAGQNGFSTWS
jgi:hypothetical protein